MGQDTVNAVEFVLELREKEQVYQRITEYLFGYEYNLEKQRTLDLINRKVETKKKFTDRNEENMYKIKQFNMIKEAIWNCVLDDPAEVPREEQQLDLILLRDLM